MNKNIVVKIALIIAFVLALISLITHNDISSLIAIANWTLGRIKCGLSRLGYKTA